MRADTDPMDLDDTVPLNMQEIRRLRRLMRDDDRATWAMKKLRVLVPILVACVVGAWQLWDWAAKHLKVMP